jgi:hypothetical protein
MKEEKNGQMMKRVLLEVVADAATRYSTLQQVTLLQEAAKRLKLTGLNLEQALLTYWFDLFRSGHLSWGYNLANPDPPFCHLTEQGRKTLENLSRDPANPDGYLSHLHKISALNPIADSYMREALNTYNSNCIKATAVLVGIALETILLEVRDVLLEKMKSLSKVPPKGLLDWRIKCVIDALNKELEKYKAKMPPKLAEGFEALWPAIIYQIRTTRNDAGHPKSIEPVAPESVHAGLLMFPELLRFTTNLKSWVISDYS